MFLCLALFSLPVPAKEGVARAIKEKEWQQCDKNDDCVTVDSACPNFYWTVNKKFINENKKQNRYLRPLIECGPPPAQSQKSVKPRCENGLCILPRVRGQIDKAQKSEINTHQE